MDPGGVVETDPNFEPQLRVRSNTWPQPRPDNYVDKDDQDPGIHDPAKLGDGIAVPKKSTSRRNAWGNMSYADLITQAIQSSPEKRLTLSQIYDWMVQNVPYFKDKGDSNSSAGWKNSIRHNLSLHNRFMRVQNEGTGKSSWWMINPDAKPGKAARRRATSMETQKYEKRRGRVKKKVEALRNGLDATPSPSSSISESLDMYPDSPLHPGFQLSPDFRPRASSNASSCSRLSPIPAVESDMHDSQVSPLSPIHWVNSDHAHLVSDGGLVGLFGNSASDRYSTDQLVDTLAETMKLTVSGSGADSYLSECGLKSSPTTAGQLSPQAAAHLGMAGPPSQQQGPQQSQNSQTSGTNGYSLQPHQYPGSTGGNAAVSGGAGNGVGQYHGEYQYQSRDELPKLIPLQRSPQRMMHDNMNVSTSYTLTNLQALSPAPSAHSLSPPHSMDTLAPAVAAAAAAAAQYGPARRIATSEIGLNHLTSHSSAYNSPVNSNNNNNNNSSSSSISNSNDSNNTTSGFCALGPTATTHGARSLQGPPPPSHPADSAATLRAALMQKEAGMITTTPTASQMMGHLMALNNGIPNDLDLSIDSFQGELECDVDQVIRHELSVDGNLDFNFTDPNNLHGGAAQGMPPPLPTSLAAIAGRHWVH